MEAVFCVDCLEDALRAYGRPEIFNSEQGSQFTSDSFTGVLKREDVYLKGYSAVGELLLGLTQYFSFYNVEHPHQGLQNRTPDEVYQSACGGGAMILDKYGAAEAIPIALRSTGTAFDEVELKTSGIQNDKNRGSAVQLRVESSAT